MVFHSFKELYDHSQPRPSLIIDGFETWFQNQDISLYFSPENSRSVSRLWIGFLSFFIESFNFRSTVVQIRTAKKLGTREKSEEWRRKAICIEDPFELSHNLTRNVSQTNLSQVLEVFKNELELCTAQHFSFKSFE